MTTAAATSGGEEAMPPQEASDPSASSIPPPGPPRALLVTFSLLLPVLVGVGMFLERAERRRLRATVESELGVVGRLKADQIAQWRADRLADAAELTESRFVGERAAAALSSPQSQIDESLLSFLRSMQIHEGYDDVLLADAAGGIRWSARSAKDRLHEQTIAAVVVALGRRQPALGDLHAGPVSLPPHVDVVAPVFGPGADGQPLGAIVLQSQAKRFLFPLLESWPTASGSAETLLIRRDGDAVLFLNELRHRKDTALKLRVPLSSANVLAVQAALGKRGVVEGTDYRGVEVLGALTAVPDSEWLLVAKVDTAEALAGVRTRSLLVAGFIALVILAGAIAFVAFWQHGVKSHYERQLRVEKARNDSEARFRSLFEHMIEGFAHCRMVFEDGRPSDFVYLDVNPAFESLTGLKNVIGHRVSELIPGIRRSNPEVFEIYGRVASTGQPQSFETYLEPLGIWFETTAYSPSPGHFVAVFDNVSARKRAEEALRASESQLRAMFDLAAVGIAQADPATGRWLRVNQKMCAITGYTAEEMLELRTADITHPDDRDSDWAAFQEVVRGEAPAYRMEKRYRRKDGTDTWVNVNVTVIRDDAGVPVRTMATIEDINERKRAESALRESEAFTRTVLDNLPVGVAVNSVDPAVTFQYVNDNFLRCYRTTPERLTGPDAFWEAAYEDPVLRAQVKQRVLAGVGSGDPQKMEWTDIPISRRGEETSYVSAKNIPIPGTALMISTVWDVTARKEADEEREVAIEFLREVNESETTQELVRAAVRFFKVRSGCDAVGIRLQSGEDYPYYEARGFPDRFVRLENSLCKRDERRQIVRDDSGHPVLDCMCGTVIRGRADPTKPFFSQAGSFWTNCTTELLATTTEADRRGRTRNRCNGQGYESVALIPLATGGRRLGLLQLNDHRRGCFTARGIARYERLAGYLAVALSKLLADEALRASEERYRTVAEFTYDWEYWRAPDGKLLYVSPSCERITGYPASAFLETPSLLEEIVHPDDRAILEEHHASHAAPGQDRTSVDMRIIRRDGSELWLNHSCLLVFDLDGNPLGRRGSNRDITIRKVAEDALRLSEARFATVFRDSPQPIALARLEDSVLLDVNDAWCRLSGFSHEEAVGSTTVALGMWPDPAERQRVVDSLVAGGMSQGIEMRLRSKSGGVLELLMAADTVEVAGEPCLLTMSTDIGERKRGEKTLRLQEERLRLAIEAAALGTWHWDMASGRLLWSERTYAMFGVPPGTPVTHADFLGAIHPDDRGAVEANLRAAVSGFTDEAEFRVRWPDESEHWIASIGRVYRDAGGASPRMEGVVRDVTEQRRLETQLRQAQKMEAIGQLAGGVAHDFNNILGVIQGRCEMMLRTLREDDPLFRNVSLIQQSGDRAAALTRQLLAFSRQQAIQPEILDLSVSVRQLEGMLKRLIGENVEITTALASDLGRIKADRTQMEQVLINLAVNARDAMPDGGRLVIEAENVTIDDVHSRAHLGAPPGPYVLLAVSDTGCGMDSKTKERIFEPFFTTKELGKGTGLGLATVYGIVKQAGGYIWVNSEVGAGSTFKIYLPRTDEAASTTTRTSDVGPLAGQGERILVVEDDSGMREVVRDVLQGLGYEVTLAANGGEALLAIEEAGLRPDLLLTDCVMPGMSGEVLADRLRRTIPDLRVLFMSGYTDQGARHGELRQAMPLVQKPFRSADLAARVRIALASEHDRE